MIVHDAARSLRMAVGRPSWLISIGVGETDAGQAAILLYVARQELIPQELVRDGWEGFPIVVRLSNPFVAAGGQN
jgi:hypothetical protein